LTSFLKNNIIFQLCKLWDLQDSGKIPYLEKLSRSLNSQKIWHYQGKLPRRKIMYLYNWWMSLIEWGWIGWVILIGVAVVIDLMISVVVFLLVDRFVDYESAVFAQNIVGFPIYFGMKTVDGLAVVLRWFRGRRSAKQQF
jgi:hypothetical protein